MVNRLEYASIYANKQSSEYARILNVSVTIHRIRSLFKLLSSYRDRGVQITKELSRQRRIQNTIKHLRCSVLQKKKNSP